MKRGEERERRGETCESSYFSIYQNYSINIDLSQQKFSGPFNSRTPNVNMIILHCVNLVHTLEWQYLADIHSVVDKDVPLGTQRRQKKNQKRGGTIGPYKVHQCSLADTPRICKRGITSSCKERCGTEGRDTPLQSCS
jgi:hypothetical protein